jgi:glycosyltransferase involved in cell wall biosynthesis
LPKADFYLATSIGSALTLDSIPKIMPQRKYYLIQHYEDWGGIPSDLVDETYRFPMNKICIAPWLVEKVNQVGKSACLIPNGFDQSEFPLKNPIETRSNNTIAFLGAELPWKGVVDTIEALRIVRAKYPKLVVQVFGTGERLDWYPEWVSYKRLPTHEELVSLYNNTAIFIGASHYEGFGLTIGEAMCCGCAIACTENGGFTVMVHHQETGLLSPIQDPAALAENIIFYIENPQERIRLAKQGNSYIRKFTWDDSVDRFVDFLEHPFEIQDEA